jgi:hypothetical protein
MTPNLTSPSRPEHRARRRDGGASSHRSRADMRASQASDRDEWLLGRYASPQGSARELIARRGAAGSLLVIDRDLCTREDRRLVAHLAADEPADNAALVCRRYLDQAPDERGRCRPLTAEDARIAPFADQQTTLAGGRPTARQAQPVDCSGVSYRLELLRTGMSIPELRWRRCRPDAVPGDRETVSLREAIAALENYEPVCALTVRALALRDCDQVSTTVLRAELARVHGSPIVLNRGLREAVLATVGRGDLSMSEIAIRCGRVKRDRRGNESGETSWLARRLGLLPESGRNRPTPWIHSDVLGLIARRGLGVSPREVELG